MISTYLVAAIQNSRHLKASFMLLTKEVLDRKLRNTVPWLGSLTSLINKPALILATWSINVPDIPTNQQPCMSLLSNVLVAIYLLHTIKGSFSIWSKPSVLVLCCRLYWIMAWGKVAFVTVLAALSIGLVSQKTTSKKLSPSCHPLAIFCTSY